MSGFLDAAAALQLSDEHISIITGLSLAQVEALRPDTNMADFPAEAQWAMATLYMTHHCMAVMAGPDQAVEWFYHDDFGCYGLSYANYLLTHPFPYLALAEIADRMNSLYMSLTM